MKNKGFIEAAIVATVVGVSIAIVSVLIFFYFFKVRVDLQMREQYIWNKVQELPLDLFSANISGESFVSRMNKVYYGFESKNSLSVVKDIVNRQLFYFYSSIPQTMGYTVSVKDITISQCPSPNCKCNPTVIAPTLIWYYCSNQCPKAGEDCTIETYVGPMPEESKCFYIGRINYHGTYPFPLSFNGTANFVDFMSYDAVEYK